MASGGDMMVMPPPYLGMGRQNTEQYACGVEASGWQVGEDCASCAGYSEQENEALGTSGWVQNENRQEEAALCQQLQAVSLDHQNSDSGCSSVPEAIFVADEASVASGAEVVPSVANLVASQAALVVEGALKAYRQKLLNIIATLAQTSTIQTRGIRGFTQYLPQPGNPVIWHFISQVLLVPANQVVAIIYYPGTNELVFFLGSMNTGHQVLSVFNGNAGTAETYVVYRSMVVLLSDLLEAFPNYLFLRSSLLPRANKDKGH